MKKRMNGWWLFAILAIGLLSPSRAQQVALDQELVRYALLEDQKQIEFFLEDFMIPESKIEAMKIYDILGDGFGEGDLARTFPSGRIYVITPGKQAQQIMNRWKFGDNIRFTAHTSDTPETFENTPDSIRALGGVFASVLRGLRRNYQGMPFKLYLEQKEGVAAVEMWNYDRHRLRYAPPPERSKDLIKPVYNLLYLEKTISDTVYTTPAKMKH